ncbi:SPOR domain-containing protein [Sphingomonas abietis]|uniref:SPOR domain-containing protein n=1 Tax=Sphingomonas abietis TaxID=3012344 RepID=A0ABY7NQ19_9SPHN|nr:SPOR domain-containing protein [Sphingomonas abietis]WBO22034.1 SPOR domain-containing protein [Sphingomonas abietis]
MSDTGRSMGGNADEDRLPWLEPVEDETAEEGVSAARLFAGLIVALVALGLVVGGVYWLKQRASGAEASGSATTIAAQPGPYKVKPAEAGGMEVKGQGDSAYAASEGADPNARIDISKIPEAPISKDKAAPAPAPAPAPVAAKPTEVAQAPVKQVPVKTAPVPAAKPEAKPAPAPAKTETAAAPVSGGTIQLGALDSQAKADGAWKSLSGRYAYLGALNHMVVKAEVNGKTYYRLRASAGGQASSICAKLKVAGEACSVVG